MKNQFLSVLILFSSIGYLKAQKFTEKTIPLSKQATDGFFKEALITSDGGLDVYFDYREKKVNHTELYSFDPALNLKVQKIAEPPVAAGEKKESFTRNAIWANVGGNNSFDINSLKLKLFKITYEYTWSPKNQRYYRNVIKRENVKVKGADDNNMDGYMAFGNSQTGELFVLAGIEQKKNKRFSLLKVSNDLNFSEDPLPLTGNYNLVYGFAAPEDGSSTEDFEISKGDMVFIFAPVDKSAKTNEYQCLRYNNNGKLISKITINTPSPNTIFTSCRMQDNSLYLFGAYTKSKDNFGEVFGEFGNIVSPGYLSTEKLYGAENIRMFKYYKSLENEDPIAMVCAKISGESLVYLKDFSIKSLESLVRKAPNQKKLIPYQGKALDIQQFQVLSNGDFMVSGQETGRISVALGEGAKSYKRLYCFHFNANGNLRALYGVEPESIDDKFNTLFPILQQFVISNDNKTIFWLLLENVSSEGYETIMDQANGKKTWYARYYPSMISIDTDNAMIKTYEELGARKYYLNKKTPFFYNEQQKSFTFIGRDLKNKNLWISKYQLN